MAKKATKRGKTSRRKKKLRPNKRLVWLDFYLDASNHKTFLNKTESAVSAKYKAKTRAAFRSIGYENFTKLDSQINAWLKEHGLSEKALSLKLLSLMDAKETKFFSTPEKDEKGKTTGIMIETREVEAIEVQRKALHMAMTSQGMYKDADPLKGAGDALERLLDKIAEQPQPDLKQPNE